ncbi:hypothetical protein [Saccharopolyspora hordei]|uniref:Uncharacterized protein n=1 Tax=Saccharopolyspora hordei TaxID=1838 RepID=A0A853AQ01_9PSEU|nr:hypothetical protein [Saccharopolyspora hordei]NYI85659.1 hypothetical protein [Saccharopolyspora hordei]
MDRVDQPAPEHQRPEGVDDATVAAVGKLSEALETVERARGHLYEFHQLIGSSDAKLSEAVSALRDCDQDELADTIERELVGRNVIHGRWTFQIVEDFDDGYWSCVREHERRARDQLLKGRRHVFEAEMKERERSVRDDGSPLPGHEATPD